MKMLCERRAAVNALVPLTPPDKLRLGIELGFFNGRPLVYGGTEPVAIDAQAGKGKLTRFLGVNLVSPRTAHLSKIITDPKDAELAWVCWKTLERQGYRVRFINRGQLYGYPSESYNLNTRLLEIAAKPALRPLVWEAAYDSASYLVPVDPNPAHKWIGQGVRTSCALYNKITALYPSARWPCNVGGLWDFFGRAPDEIAQDLLVWASDSRMEEDWGMCRLIASLTASTDQWNAYSSTVVERLQGFQPGSAGRAATQRNSFDPADMKREKTALFIIGSARSDTSRTFVGAMTAAIIERFAESHGHLRALVVGEEWGQLYVSNFPEILTLYRQGGINFLACSRMRARRSRRAMGARQRASGRKPSRIHSIAACPTTTRCAISSTAPGKRPSWCAASTSTRTRSTAPATACPSKRDRCSRWKISGKLRAASVGSSKRGIKATSPSTCRTSGSVPSCPACSATCGRSRIGMIG